MYSNFIRLIASALFLLFVSANYLLADTIHYHNLKYGTEVTFPTGLFFKQEEIPLDGSGMAWTGKDESRLAIYTSANALVLSKNEFADMVAKPYENEGIKVGISIDDNIVTLAGNENGQMFYMRYIFDDNDIIHGLIIKYPAADAAPYVEYLDDIASSLTVNSSN